jgi:type I restriction enzyme S subunit
MKPPLSEQIEIANHIDASIELFVELVSKTNSMIEMLREYRMALISAAVTGKIDLRGWTGTGDDA